MQRFLRERARILLFSFTEKGDPPVSMQVGLMRSRPDIVKVKGSVFTLNAYEFLGRAPAVSRGRLTWRTLTLLLCAA